MLSACNSEVSTGKADAEYIHKISKDRKDKDIYLVSEDIIEPADLKDFKGLNYFDPDTAYRIKAQIKRLPPIQINMLTTTDRRPVYYTYAQLQFKVGDSLCSLIAYVTDEFAKEGLFIPFKDLSNKKETYGGGRYLDVEYKGETEWIELDFNKAYNPYCHYNHSFSCPLVPEENHLKIAVPAGEKKFH